MGSVFPLGGTKVVVLRVILVERGVGGFFYLMAFIYELNCCFLCVVWFLLFVFA